MDKVPSSHGVQFLKINLMLKLTQNNIEEYLHHREPLSISAIYKILHTVCINHIL